MSQRYFLTAESTYEDLRISLNAALSYPNALGKSVFQTALYAPRDNFRRVLLAVDTDIPGYATIAAAIAPLLDSDAMEEVDEATYLAALATATAGASAWADITGKPAALSGGYFAVDGDDFLCLRSLNPSNPIKVETLPGGYGGFRLYSLGFAGDSTEQTTAWTGSVDWANVNNTPATFVPSAHKSSHATGGSDALTASDIGAAAASHTHAASAIVSGTVATARLGSGTASSSTFLRGDGTWATAGSSSASDLTSGTLAYARMADPTVTSPSQITASQNDYASFARGINRFSTNAARDITGMVAGNDGEVRVLCNTGTTAANTLTIKDESASSSAANRFSVPWNGDCVIPAEGSVVVFYDGTSSRWRVV